MSREKIKCDKLISLKYLIWIVSANEDNFPPLNIKYFTSIQID